MKTPFLYILIIYSLGIIFYDLFKVDIKTIKTLLIITTILNMLMYFLKVNKKHIRYCALIPIFLLGIVMTNKSSNSSAISKLYDEEVEVIAVIKENLTKEQDNKDDEFEKYLINIEKVKHEGNVYKSSEKTILNIYNETDIKIGDKIRINAQVKEPNKNRNPKLFNYKIYLQTKDIFFTLSSTGRNINILEESKLNRFEKTSMKFKNRVSQVFDESLNGKNSLIIKSIILGDSSFLDEEDVVKFRKLGLSHILAISGLHIGIIFGFILFILNIFKINRKKSMIISVIIIWAYGYLVGYPPSVLRGSIMFSFLSVASIIHYRYDSLNIVSLSAFLMLLYRPLWIFNVGFQLSYTATFTILLFTPKIKEMISINDKKIKSSLSLILAVQLGTFPVVVYYFNELQILSILANLILVPILSFSLILGFTGLILSALNIKLSIIIGIFNNVILNLTSYIVELLNEFTHLNKVLGSPSILEILIYYFVLFILLKIIDISLLERKVQRFIYTSFILLTSLGILINSIDESISVEFIDVGQGDSCLIRTKEKNLLIDTGGSIMSNFNIGDNILLPYLRKTGAKNIDGIFLTHFHEDHAQGALSLFDSINIKNIFISYKDENNNLYKEIINKSSKHKVKVNIINAGNSIAINKHSNIKVISPTKDMKHMDDNNKSLTFIFNAYNKKILFTGDIEREAEGYIVSRYENQDIDVLKVPHHGSDTSSTEEFISHFNPKIAVFQVGKNNFGHPKEDVLERYKDKKAIILRNDELGLITLKINEKKIEVSSYLKERIGFKNFVMENIYSVLLFTLYNIVILKLVLVYRERSKYELQRYIKGY